MTNITGSSRTCFRWRHRAGCLLAGRKPGSPGILEK
jgi:hypothetical protein